jgi:hypothetical protein
MSNRSTTSSSGGGGLFLLFLLFLVLKLTHVIDWSWWWITAPLWGPVAPVALVVGAMAAFVAWSPSKRAHLRDREAAQMARRQQLLTETAVRLAAGEMARKGLTTEEACEGAERMAEAIRDGAQRRGIS